MPGTGDMSTLAARLDNLFEQIRPPGQGHRKYTNVEVAEAIKKADPGIRVSRAYLSALRNGAKTNPSTDLLAALAHFFSVPVSYLLTSTPTGQAVSELELAKVAHNHGVRALALRALDLSPEGLAAVTQIVEHVLQSDKRTDD
ncbi:helix-turn-helix domain-containing protein [Streptomyces sp. RB6PN25]|uniref:Helix-turn-helix domain-containing protein n=1 Tax=Streptomyces humicola TaxID=2953240 RepID=A0ABT1PW41_9ACTN|nr:helix-turn-helix transcriptional regulator [Streptomyces humicola]MCQ4080750.1 helix-turn-helix domain-containing protein [Streptomyces humicola]